MWTTIISALIGQALSFFLGLFKSAQAKKLSEDENALAQIKTGDQAIIDSSKPADADKLRSEYQRD